MRAREGTIEECPNNEEKGQILFLVISIVG